MKKVEEAVNAKRAWMNTKQHACSQTPKHSNPTVKCSEIRAEKSVRQSLYDWRGIPYLCTIICFPQNLEASCKPIVTKPKPKVEPPKDTAPEKTEEKTEGEAAKTEEGEGGGDGGAKNTEGATETQGDEKMEADPPKGDAEDMELD